MTHLGARISSLVDGELGHDARDRALSHIAHCAACREQLEQERAVKDRLSGAAAPPPSDRLVAGLLALAEPGDPVPPRDKPMPLAPLVPNLPAPGRRGRSGGPRNRADSSAPGVRTQRTDGSQGAGRSAGRTHRLRYATAGAFSVGILVLGTAFAVGGSQPGRAPVVPTTAELSTEHAATSSGIALRDPAFDAVTASFGGLTLPTAPPR